MLSELTLIRSKYILVDIFRIQFRPNHVMFRVTFLTRTSHVLLSFNRLGDYVASVDVF